MANNFFLLNLCLKKERENLNLFCYHAYQKYLTIYNHQFKKVSTVPGCMIFREDDGGRIAQTCIKNRNVFTFISVTRIDKWIYVIYSMSLLYVLQALGISLSSLSALLCTISFSSWLAAYVIKALYVVGSLPLHPSKLVLLICKHILKVS